MKQYNCPDCTHTEDTCENCTRYQMYHRTNFNEYNHEYSPWWPYQNIQTFTNIPPACQNYPNHPSNGGSGICFCTLGQQTFY